MSPYVVNGTEWNFGAMLADEIQQTIEAFLAFVDDVAEAGERLAVGDDFQTRPMHGDLALWDMFAEGSPAALPGELGREMSAWLGRVDYYPDDPDWPAGADDVVVSIDGAAPINNPDVAWVHHKTRASIPAASVTLAAARVSDTTTAQGTAPIHFVRDACSLKAFWREAIPLEGDNADSLRRHAASAYPDVLFVDGVLAGLDDLAGGYFAMRERVQKAFSILNDWGAWAFTWPPPAIKPNEAPPPDQAARPANQLIEQRFRALGLEVAPENPNVGNDRVCREARETAQGGRTLYCHWHIKLEPHRNRIHLHQPVPESGERIVVGMIAEHLPLP